MEHCATAQRVHVHELYSGHGGAREYGASDGVGNVVKFQVQEDTWAKCRNLAYSLRPCCGKELAADLEHTDKIGNLLGKF
jgi:hypothetical protein